MAGKRLVRSTNDRKIAGVAAGVADFFGMDTHTVRVLWVLAVLVGGFGLLAYMVLWIALPEATTDTPSSSSAVRIAEERYALGEISAEDLRRIKEDLA